MIWDVHPGSRIRILIFLPIPDPEARGQKVTGSQIVDPDPQRCSGYPVFSSKHPVMLTILESLHVEYPG